MLVSYKKWLAGHEQAITLQFLHLYRTKHILSNMFAHFTSVFIALVAMTGIVAAIPTNNPATNPATNPNANPNTNPTTPTTNPATNTCSTVCCDQGQNVSRSVRLLLSSSC
jgi:hypothetical protein